MHLGLSVHERGVEDGGDAAEPRYRGVAGKAERVPLACSAPARLLRGLVDHVQKALVASQPRAAHGDRVQLGRDRELVDQGFQKEDVGRHGDPAPRSMRSEEHTSELQSLMRISYAVFCLKKKKTKQQHKETTYYSRNRQQRSK